MPMKVDTDKLRAYAITPVIETGRAFLPESASWLVDYLDSMAAFPNGMYDDEVDSTTQALNYMIGRGGAAGAGVFEYYREQAEAMRAAGAGRSL